MGYEVVYQVNADYSIFYVKKELKNGYICIPQGAQIYRVSLSLHVYNNKKLHFL